MLLISKTDIKQYRPIADIDYARIDIHIRESQEHDLKPILGDALYYDFITNYSDSGHAKYTEYQNLLNGTTYTYSGDTIEFKGIKPLLSYFTLSRLIVSNPIHFTRFGTVQKTNNNSTPIPTDQIRLQSSELKSMGSKYQNDLKQFLCQEGADYPLYDNNNAQKNRTGFNFFGV